VNPEKSFAVKTKPLPGALILAINCFWVSSNVYKYILLVRNSHYYLLRINKLNKTKAFIGFQANTMLEFARLKIIMDANSLLT
jgi:hypothetical protein